MDNNDSVLVRENVPKSVWSIDVFWFYVELFHLLLYKYLYGFGVNADRRCAVAINVVRWQQFIITDVWIRIGAKCAHTQRPTVISKGKLKNELTYR